MKNVVAWMFFLFPSHALSDIIRVQIGELSDRTRAILTIPTGSEWLTEVSLGKITVQIASATAFQGDTLQKLPGAGRIASITENRGEGSLVLEYTCRCTAKSHIVNERFLIIDILAHAQEIESLPLSQTLASLERPWLNAMPQAITSPLVSDGLTSEPITSVNGPLDVAVAQGIASGAYQGFLEFRESAIVQPKPALQEYTLESIAIGIQSQLSTLNPSKPTLPSDNHFNCEEVETRLVDRWADDTPFHAQVTRARNRIVQDSLDQDAYISLAIILVGNGLGHEAQIALDDIAIEDDLVRALRFIAQTIDNPTPPTLIGLEECSANLAFWNFLANRESNKDNQVPDPNELMMSYKLLPQALQLRMMIPFANALSHAGYRDFQAELENFKNVIFASIQEDPTQASPVIDFDGHASAREILRTDATTIDLLPLSDTPFNVTSLELPVLETLRIERRDTPAEPTLLNEVLHRHINNGNFSAVVDLLMESEQRLDPSEYAAILERNLSASLTRMSDAELLAFAFRKDLPNLTDSMRIVVGQRLETMGISAPDGFESSRTKEAIPAQPSVDPTIPELPVFIQLSDDTTPSFVESEQLLEDAAAMRNAIETLINDDRP